MAHTCTTGITGIIGRTLSPAPLPKIRPDLITNDRQAIIKAEELADAFAIDAHIRDRDRILPWNEIERYTASGLWGITVPRQYGGAEVSSWTLAQVISLIASSDGSLGHIPQNHFYALEALRVGGTPAQKQFFYERVLAGERFGNALAEIGQRDYKRRTRLEKEGDRWYVHGQKFYCTGALFAHWIPTLAISGDTDQQNTVLVFIPRDADGVNIIDDWDGFGQRVTGSGSVSFERVAVKPEWIVPFKASFDEPTTIGPFAQIMHAAIDLGIGQGAFRATLPYVREHSRPWLDSGVERASDDPLLLQQVGQVHIRLRAAQALVKRAARHLDAAQLEPTENSVAQASVAVAQARALTSQAGLLAANKLFELAGTSATLAGNGFDRYWRNVRTHTLHDPVRWKFHAVGNFILNDRHPPRHGAL